MTPEHFAPTTAAERERVFNHIFQTNCWAAEETRSGSGSRKVETRGVVSQLPGLLDRLKVRSLIDVCGDFNWQFEVLQRTNMLESYLGIDIVPAAVEAARKRFEQEVTEIEPRVAFRACDIVHGDLPAADAILLRDVLVHLKTGDVFASLDNLRRAGIRYLIATTFPSFENTEIDTGWWRVLNLEVTPFELGPALEILDELNPEVPRKSLGVWPL